jgi:hypothetical protein
MKFIKLTGQNNAGILYVNPEMVSSLYAQIDPNTDQPCGTALFMGVHSGGQGMVVVETPEEIVALCEGILH